MAAELFSLTHILKTVFALISVCAAAALFITYVLPKFRKVGAAQSEGFGLKVIFKHSIDKDNSCVIMEDAKGARFLFSSNPSAGLKLLGSFDSEDNFKV